MKHLYLVIGLLAATLTCASANAQQLEYWGEAGGWDVLVDPSLGYGCLIQAEFEDGSLVRIGFDRDAETGYLTAFNMSWGDIQEGAVYPIAFDLDGQQYEGEAIGMYLEGMPGADIIFTNPDFLFDVARKYTMTLYNESEEVMVIDLEGTFAGLEAAIACQDDYG